MFGSAASMILVSTPECAGAPAEFGPRQPKK